MNQYALCMLSHRQQGIKRMTSTWMTLEELALNRQITVDEALRIVNEAHCPKVFRATATLYLV
jgi:hypothetical protein